MYSETKFKNFNWIDISSPTKAEIEKVSKDNDLDIYLVADSLEPGHLPKIETQDDLTFMILRAYVGDENKSATSVQELSSKIAIFIKENILITVHRLEYKFIDKLKLKKDKDIDIHDHSLSIIECIIDSYIPSANILSKDIDNIEKTIFLKNLKEVSLEDLYYLRTESRISKKLLFITEKVLNQFRVPKESIPALQDIKDSLVNIILQFGEVLDDANNLMNTYMSVTTKKTNDVMKLLTIFSAFFLPLTFMVGVYGMNFQYMPEIKWYYGYPTLLAAMAAVTITIFSWFKKRKIM